MDLPQALKPYGREKRWVVWKYEGDERPTKVLYQPTNHEHRARNNDQSHWSNAETAIGVAGAFEFDGIGLCLMDSELAAFDIDDCRDPRTGAIDPWVEALVRDCNSYTEVTPRGKGLRIIGYSDGVLSKGRKLPAPSEGVSIECYEEAVASLNASFGSDLHVVVIDFSLLRLARKVIIERWYVDVAGDAVAAIKTGGDPHQGGDNLAVLYNVDV